MGNRPKLWILEDKKNDEAAAGVSAASLKIIVKPAERRACASGEDLEDQFTDC